MGSELAIRLVVIVVIIIVIIFLKIGRRFIFGSIATALSLRRFLSIVLRFRVKTCERSIAWRFVCEILSSD
jgi:hypothetical protein